MKSIFPQDAQKNQEEMRNWQTNTKNTTASMLTGRERRGKTDRKRIAVRDRIGRVRNWELSYGLSSRIFPFI